MQRLIITFNYINLSHLDVDTVETSVKTKTVSIKAPDNIIAKYQEGEYLFDLDLLQFNTMEQEASLCKKVHPYENQMLRCEATYQFAISAKLVTPVYTKLML